MGVTRDEAVLAYRMFLGREPESEDVLRSTMAARDIREIRHAFLGSLEFQAQYNALAPLAVGRFMDVTKVDVDIRCSAAQLQLMFDRIAKAWQDFGQTEPHWSVMVDEAFKNANIGENIEAFYESGKHDVEFFLNFLRRADISPSFEKALDYGCGVGRLTMALSGYARHVKGVDISPPHLRLATDRARDQGVANIGFDAVANVADLDRYADFNLIISRIVLQHNPPPVMAAIYAKLLAALAPGGVAVVQMPTYIHQQSFSAARYLDTDQPQMEMNGLPQSIIFSIIEEAGCGVLEVREDGSTGNVPGLSHIFAVRKR